MTDRKQYLNDYAKNYTQIRITIRKDNPFDQEILKHLQKQENTSQYLKALVLADISKKEQEDEALAKLHCRPLEELVESTDWPDFNRCHDTDDVIDTLDRLDISRETGYFDINGKKVLDPEPDIFMKTIARPNMNGAAEWYGFRECGELVAIVKIYGFDWSDESQTFETITEEIIGWDW